MAARVGSAAVEKDGVVRGEASHVAMCCRTGGVWRVTCRGWWLRVWACLTAVLVGFQCVGQFEGGETAGGVGSHWRGGQQ